MHDRVVDGAEHPTSDRVVVGFDAGDLTAKVGRYRTQAAAYALALETATGEPVRRCVFVFLGDGAPGRGTAVEREVSDLPRAVAELRDRLAGSA